MFGDVFYYNKDGEFQRIVPHCIDGANPVADTEHMLMNAEQHIEKLTCQLKEKELEIHEHVKRCEFYEQLIKNLTTFK